MKKGAYLLMPLNLGTGAGRRGKWRGRVPKTRIIVAEDGTRTRT
jgi:hypothetical protein